MAWPIFCSVAAYDMSTVRIQQQLAHALLAHGVSGEVVYSISDGFTVVVDDVSQVETARAAVADYPEVTLVIAHGLGCCG